MKNFLNVFFRLVKLSLPNYGDFELLFSQIQQFITVCSKEQIQFAGEKCKFLVNVQCAFFSILILISRSKHLLFPFF